MSRIGIGLVGYGFIGRIHAASFSAVPWMYPGAPHPRLVGVVTATAASAERARQEGGYPVATTSLSELLAREDIQAISCCTPNDAHREVLLAAMAAGKHVYCDKPLALNLEQAREIAALAAASRGIYQMTFQYRFVPAIQRARQLVRDGFLGRLFSFRAVYLHAGYTDPMRPMSWRLQYARSGGGAVMDLGAHVIDLLRYLVGEFRAVCATERTMIGRRPAGPGGPLVPVDVDDLLLAQAELDNGAIGTLEFSRLATGAEDDLRLELRGQDGALAFDLMQPDFLEVYDARQPDAPLGGSRGWTRVACLGRYAEHGALPGPKFTQGWWRFHIASAFDFLRNIEQGHMNEGSPSFQDGLEAQRVVSALQLSAREGRWVETRAL